MNTRNNQDPVSLDERRNPDPRKEGETTHRERRPEEKKHDRDQEREQDDRKSREQLRDEPEAQANILNSADNNRNKPNPEPTQETKRPGYSNPEQEEQDNYERPEPEEEEEEEDEEEDEEEEEDEDEDDDDEEEEDNKDSVEEEEEEEDYRQDPEDRQRTTTRNTRYSPDEGNARDEDSVVDEYDESLSDNYEEDDEDDTSGNASGNMNRRNTTARNRAGSPDTRHNYEDEDAYGIGYGASNQYGRDQQYNRSNQYGREEYGNDRRYARGRSEDTYGAYERDRDRWDDSRIHGATTGRGGQSGYGRTRDEYRNYGDRDREQGYGYREHYNRDDQNREFANSYGRGRNQFSNHYEDRRHGLGGREFDNDDYEYDYDHGYNREQESNGRPSSQHGYDRYNRERMGDSGYGHDQDDRYYRQPSRQTRGYEGQYEYGDNRYARNQYISGRQGGYDRENEYNRYAGQGQQMRRGQGGYNESYRGQQDYTNRNQVGYGYWDDENRNSGNRYGRSNEQYRNDAGGNQYGYGREPREYEQRPYGNAYGNSGRGQGYGSGFGSGGQQGRNQYNQNSDQRYTDENRYRDSQRNRSYDEDEDRLTGRPITEREQTTDTTRNMADNGKTTKTGTGRKPGEDNSTGRRTSTTKKK